VHCHCHCPHGSDLAPVEVCDPDLGAAKLGADGGRLGSCTPRQTRYFREASLKHADRTSMRTAARYDELAALAAAAVVAVAVAADGEDNMVDPVAGKALIEKKSQKTQVRQGLNQWDLGTRNPHRSHDDQKGPEGDPDRDVRRILLEVQVGEEQAGKTRPNGDV